MWNLHRLTVVLATLLVLAVVGASMTGDTDSHRSDPTAPRPLDEAIACELAGGWRLVRRPDLPGPYRRTGSAHQSHVGGGGGARWRNGVSEAGHQFVREPGVEQLAVLLEAADGRLTVAVFAR